MTSLKYAVVERERRWLLSSVPDLAGAEVALVTDRYVTGSRLRLREVSSADGTTVRKLNHKVRLGPDASEVASTSVYLDDAEWALLLDLDAAVLRKRRHRVAVAGRWVAVDVLAGACEGIVLAEVDGGDAVPADLPATWPVLAEVTLDEAFTGAGLAAASREQVVARAASYGLRID